MKPDNVRAIDSERLSCSSTKIFIDPGRGYDAELLVPEETDILLIERYQRVNTWCKAHGKQCAICISIHVNAFGNGSEWTQPHGWSVYTSKGQTAADTLCPAVLTENGFMTNAQDLQLLESRSGKQAIADLHVEGIIEYLMNAGVSCGK